MALNREEVLETAQKHLAKGNVEKAIVEYERLLADDPADVQTLRRLGEAHARLGAAEAAIDAFIREADAYIQRGFLRKAVPVYKKILKLDTSRLDIALNLADLYKDLDLPAEALNLYDFVATAYAREGQMEPALSTLGTMVELAPNNIPARIKYAEALSKAGRIEEAADQFEEGAVQLRELDRTQDYLKVAERLLYHRPDDIKLARQLADEYLQAGQPKRALPKLQLAFNANPRDILTLSLLARAFQMLGQIAKTVSVYREIAKIYGEAGRVVDQADALRRLLEVEPADTEALRTLSMLEPVLGEAAVAASAPGEDRTSLAPPPEGRESIEVFIEDGGGDPSLTEPGRRASIPPADHVDSETRIAKLLAECEVFTRYGLRNKVVAQLELIIELAPDHVEARERLKELYLEDDRIDDAIEQLEALGSLFQDDRPQLAQLYLKQILRLDPNNTYASSIIESRPSLAPQPSMHPGSPTLAGTPVPPAVEAEYAAAPGSAAADEGGPARDTAPPRASSEALESDELYLLDDDVELLDEDLLEEDTSDDLAAVDTSGPVTEEALAVFPPGHDTGAPEATPSSYPPAASERPSREAFEVFGTGEHAPAVDSGAEAFAGPATDRREPLPEDFVDTATDAPITAEEEYAPDTMASAELAPTPADLAAYGGAFDEEAEPDAYTRPTPVDFPAADLEEAAALPTPIYHPTDLTTQQLLELEEMIEEIEFFMVQGLTDEARATLDDALESFPNHPELLEKLEELGGAADDRAGEGGAEPTPGADAATSTADGDDQAFALAEKLAEELGGETATEAGVEELDVESVFSQFKQGVQEQLGSEDTETRFDLGIAYKEMGLLTDAIDEFRLSMNSPERRCMSLTMIGACYVQLGDNHAAIEHFLRGLESDLRTPGEELGLHFELAKTYEMLDDLDNALLHYREVLEREPSFQDIRERVAQLEELLSG